MTAYERSNWRDMGLSQRHRDWGFNCPAVDLDFLMVEYNNGLPAAIVEYKNHRALVPSLTNLHPTYRALQALANAARLPFCLSFYWPDVWAFRVYPINDLAKAHFRGPYENLTERQYVTRLYQIRQLVIEHNVLNHLHTDLPPTNATATGSAA